VELTGAARAFTVETGMIAFLRKVAPISVIGALLAPTIGACGDLEIRSVYMALDGQGDRRRNSFFTDTTNIFCDADYAANRRDTTFNALIRYVVDANGAPVDVVMAIGELAPGISHGVMSLTWPRPMDPMGGVQPFPKGKYRCEYYVDGIDPKTGVSSKMRVIQGTADFTVEYINCPVAGAVAGTKCAGYVAPGSGSNGCLNALNMKQACNCDGTGFWVCP
jgi:hypothetical protein